MGERDSVRAYNKEFPKLLLQVPVMGQEERLFHYSQGLKRHIRIEVERLGSEALQKAMKVADKMTGIYSQKAVLMTMGVAIASGVRIQLVLIPSAEGTMEMDQFLCELVAYLRGNSCPLQNVSGTWKRNYVLCVIIRTVVQVITRSDIRKKLN